MSGMSWVNESRAALLASKTAVMSDCWLSAAEFMRLDCSQGKRTSLAMLPDRSCAGLSLGLESPYA